METGERMKDIFTSTLQIFEALFIQSQGSIGDFKIKSENKVIFSIQNNHN